MKAFLFLFSFSETSAKSSPVSLALMELTTHFWANHNHNSQSEAKRNEYPNGVRPMRRRSLEPWELKMEEGLHQGTEKWMLGRRPTDVGRAAPGVSVSISSESCERFLRMSALQPSPAWVMARKRFYF
ncbi:unnamed protein product [Rangifer tarandus platyrhynchus]|uniref:Uncharacterized protein n=1 Tax=Rangifer tarandus platyrhynchus TaxID=3082113 RepID=A0AC59ZSC3_RANTA